MQVQFLAMCDIEDRSHSLCCGVYEVGKVRGREEERKGSWLCQGGKLCAAAPDEAQLCTSTRHDKIDPAIASRVQAAASPRALSFFSFLHS